MREPDHDSLPWHCLYFLPLPQGQGSLRPTWTPGGTTLAATVLKAGEQPTHFALSVADGVATVTLNRPERNTPEIQRSDLAEVVLLLHSLGIKKASTFDWLDKPHEALDRVVCHEVAREIADCGRYPLIPDAHACNNIVGPGCVGFNAGHRWTEGLFAAAQFSIRKALDAEPSSVAALSEAAPAVQHGLNERSSIGG